MQECFYRQPCPLWPLSLRRHHAADFYGGVFLMYHCNLNYHDCPCSYHYHYYHDEDVYSHNAAHFYGNTHCIIVIIITMKIKDIFLTIKFGPQFLEDIPWILILDSSLPRMIFVAGRLPKMAMWGYILTFSKLYFSQMYLLQTVFFQTVFVSNCICCKLYLLQVVYQRWQWGDSSLLCHLQAPLQVSTINLGRPTFNFNFLFIFSSSPTTSSNVLYGQIGHIDCLCCSMEEIQRVIALIRIFMTSTTW